MKTIRTVISIVLVACVALGVVMSFTGNISDLSAYNNSLKTAREQVEKGLYQKAVSSFETALKYKEKKDVRNELLNAYKLGVDDGVIGTSSFASAYEAACELYPKESVYWESLIDIYLNSSSYSKAYEYYNNAVKNGAKSDRLTEQGDLIMYSYNTKSTSYAKFRRTPNGYYTVKNYDFYGIIGPDAEEYAGCAYKYITPASSVLSAVYFTQSGKKRLYDSSFVVQNNITTEFSEARAVANGLVPVKLEDGTWQYFSCEQDAYVFEKYEDASTFANGIALVKTGGTWHFIDTEGKQKGDKTFEDVKLYDNGEYIYNNVMIASVNGAYHMYDGDGKELNSFSAADMDCYYGSAIAYKGENGLWGFVGTDGKVIIEPTYKQAKSFSSGLAAVAVEVAEEETTTAEENTTAEETTAEENTTVPAQETTVGETAAETATEAATENTTAAETTVEQTTAAEETTQSSAQQNTEENIKWGFINGSNKLVIAAQYCYAGYFSSSGCALVGNIPDSYFFIALRFV